MTNRGTGEVDHRGSPPAVLYSSFRTEVLLEPAQRVLAAVEARGGLALAEHRVAVAGEADHLAGDAARAERGVELLALLDRAAIVGFRLQEQRRRLDARDVADRRVGQVEVEVVPDRLAPLPFRPEPADV